MTTTLLSTLRSIAGKARTLGSLQLECPQALEQLETRQVLAADFQLTLGEAAPGTIALGQTLNVPVIIANAGDAGATSDGSLAFYASTDNVLDDTDTLISTQAILAAELPAAGASINLTPGVAWPSVAAGTYFVFGRFTHGADAPSVAAATNTVTQLTPADFDITLGEVTPTGVVTLGQVLTVPVSITNSGQSAGLDGATLAFYVSTDDVLDDSDRLVSSQGIALAELPGPGATVNLSPTITWPGLRGGTYYVIGKLTDSTDASSVSASTNTLEVIARTFSVGKPLSFVDGDGTTVRLSLEGRGASGEGELIETSLGVYDIEIADTNSKTVFRMRARGGDGAFALDNLTVDGSLRAIDGRTTDLTGDATITGEVREIVLRDTRSDASLTIEGIGRPMKIVFRHVADLSITSESPIDQLAVHSWDDTNDVNDVIAGTWIKRLSSRGDFDADLNLDGFGARRYTLSNVDVRGRITGGTWIIFGDVGDIASRGIDSAFSSSIAGDVKSVRVHGDVSGDFAADGFGKLDIKGSVNGARFLAGTSFGDDGRAGGVDDDTGLNADSYGDGRIDFVHVLGSVSNSLFAAGVNPTNGTFNDGDDTVVAGSRINKIMVKGSVTDSFFVADILPERAKIDNRNIFTDGDPRFNDDLPGGTDQSDSTRDRTRDRTRDKSGDDSVDSDGGNGGGAGYGRGNGFFVWFFGTR